MLAITAVLPADLGGKPAFAFEIEAAKDMPPVFAFNRVLARREEASFVFGTEYSHFRGSL